MELTKEQIEIVESYLQKRKIDYLDLKVEILDHMILDIESFLDKDYAFENAFKITILKWEKHFNTRTSFYLGNWYSESKIVVDKAVKEFKPFYFLYLAAYFLPIIFLKNVSIHFDENEIVVINQIFYSLAFLSLGYVAFIFFKTTFSRQKTTYRFILKTQYTGGVIFLVMILFLGGLINDQGEMSAPFTGFAFAGFSVTFICHYFYKKHQAVIKKYKSV